MLLLCATTRQRVFYRHFLRKFPGMQNINLYGASRSIPDEVVEDSEPEREALRQTQRQERKRRKLAAMDGSAATASKTSLTNVIFISGSTFRFPSRTPH
jgi:hypothetical protein